MRHSLLIARGAIRAAMQRLRRRVQLRRIRGGAVEDRLVREVWQGIRRVLMRTAPPLRTYQH